MKNLLAFLLLLPLVALAHGDEVHTPTNAGAGAYFSAEGVSEQYELLVKYGHLEPGREAELTLFVSDYVTNRALDSLTLTITSPELPNAAFEVERVQPGVYHVHATFPEARAYTLAVAIQGPRGADLVALPGIEAGKELAAVEEPAGDGPRGLSTGLMFALGVLLGSALVLLLGRALGRRAGPRAAAAVLVLLALPTATSDVQAHGDEPHGGESQPGGQLSASFVMPKETQFLFAIETDRLGTGKYRSSTVLNATIVPADNGQAVVSSPQTGTLTQVLTRTGATVQKGQVLATVQTTLDPSTRITLESERNALRAEVVAAQKAYDRLLAIADIAAKKDIDEARARLETARANLALLSGSTGRYVTLRAPISGMIEPFSLASGSTVNAGDVLFTINNTARIIIEAQVFPRDIEAVRAGQSFVVERGGDAPATAAVKLLSVTPTVDPTNQSRRVLFELADAGGRFSIGELVSVRVLGAPSTQSALLLPNAAITEVGGKAAVFVKDAAEHYSLVYVALGDNNGTHTAVTGGAGEGERVVVAGAYQLKMVYLNQ